MSLPRETILELMALADGELEGEAKAQALAIVAGNPGARRVFDAIQAPLVGEWLAEEADRRATAAGADGIAAAVLARLQVAPGGDDSVVSFQPDSLARSARGRRPTAQMRVAAACAALALAAGIALYVRRHPRADVEPAVATRIDFAPPGAAAPSSVHTGIPGEGVEVNQIDSPGHDISVFEISGGAAAAASSARPSSVVIWVDDGTGAK